MSSSSSPDDDTRQSEQRKAAEALTEALNAEETDEKNYHIREALQFLTLEDE